jgi:hypothetical protein
MTNETRQHDRWIRVFISSAFRDMHEEREVLIKHVFPRLRKMCEERGVTLTEVDLRWGIPEEQAKRWDVLHICLTEAERCRPYVLGLLGERYGWIPGESEHALIEEQPWLRDYPETSITELEIIRGALADPVRAKQARFYFRNPTYVEQVPPERQADYREDSQSARARLIDLKNRIRRSGLVIRENYASPQQLGEWVTTDLTQVIDERFPPNTSPDPLEREAALHEAVVRSRSGVYILRQEYFWSLNEHAAGAAQPLVITGAPGVGKSALIANWCKQYRQLHSDVCVITHFIGAAADSSHWVAMLRRIMGELKRRFDISGDPPENSDDLRSAFANWLHMASARGRTILIIDALNQLDDVEGALDLIWLPTALPDNVRLILSTLPGRPLDELTRRNSRVLFIEPLTVSERRQLIQEYFGHYGK